MTESRNVQDVVILGGGYAGQMAAARLAQKGLPIRMTLVDASPHFVERVRLHQVAGGQTITLRPMKAMLEPIGVSFRQGRVVALDPNARVLTLETPDFESDRPVEVRYDWLIYALGSTVDVWAVPGITEYAHTLANHASARRFAGEVAALASRGSGRRGRVVVVGGGLTGIEAAAELAESFPGLQIELLTAGRLGDDLAPTGANHLRRAFQRLGVDLREESRVTEIRDGQAVLRGGETIPFDLCLWAGGFRAGPLAAQAGLAVNRRGQILTDPTLRAIGHPEIFAVGDAAEVAGIDGKPLRMACATGEPMGAYAADALAQVIRGEVVEPFRFGYVIRCISLGRRDGLIQFVEADDRPRAHVLTGRPAAWVKELICRFAADMPGVERRWKRPLYTWSQPRSVERLPGAGRLSSERVPVRDHGSH